MMAQCRQWKARPLGMVQNTSSIFPRQYNQQHNPGNAWQGQPFFNPTWQSQQYPTAPFPNQLVSTPTWPNLQYSTMFW
jgi:hypothetical protein